MLNICIIDDESDARDFLREVLTELEPNCRIIGEANSKASAIDLLQKNKPDVVFLDIDLKDGTGFEVLADLVSPQYPFIFTTAFNDFAIKAFQVNALDYLLKPIEKGEVKRALDKIQKPNESSDLKQQMTALLNTVQQRKVEKLVLHTTEGVYFLPISEVNHLESSGSYTTVWTTKGEKILVSSNIGCFDHLVAETDTTNNSTTPFFKVHQSHIVRLSTVRRLLKLPDGDFIVLNNGTKIPVARRRREAFLMAMGN
jgi:two-component system, LytTR family, response regulator